MIDKIALHHCPFCGDEACAEQDNDKKAFKVYCLNCPAEMRVTYKEADLGNGDFIALE